MMIGIVELNHAFAFNLRNIQKVLKYFEVLNLEHKSAKFTATQARSFTTIGAATNGG